MSSLRALRALARVELRQLRRNPWRTLLVVLLVSVPVAAMAGGSALFHIQQPTPAERRAQVLGCAALRVELGDGSALEAVLRLLPADAPREHLFAGREEVRVPGRRLATRFFAYEPGSLTGGLARGALVLAEGAAPTRGDEVALSPVLLEGLGVAPGDTVSLATGDARVTGVVLDPEDLDMPVLLRAADASRPYGGRALLVDVPAVEAPALAAELRAAGLAVHERSELGQVDGFEDLALFVIGGFGFFEAALVIAAAFAVSLRRRRREIGLVGSAGASRGGIVAAMLVSAAVQACAGGALGVAVGLGAARALYPFLDGWLRRQNGPFEVSPMHLVGALVLGVVTATAAAAIPARGAASLPIRVALGGRRPLTTSPRGWLVGGLALVGIGVGSMLFGTLVEPDAAGLAILVGSILAALGLGACSPWILGGLARFARPLPLAWRLAVRDAGRFRARNGPVVTAVLAGMSISVVLAAVLGSVEASIRSRRSGLRDDQLVLVGPGAEQVARSLSAELGGVACAPLQAAYARGELVRGRAEGLERSGWLACGDAELLRALGAESGIEALHGGRLLALLDETAVDADAIELVAGERTLASPEVELVVPTQRVRGPAFLLGTESMAALDLQPGPPPNHVLVPWVLRLPEAVTQGAVAAARTQAARVPGTFVHAEVLTLRAPRGFYRAVLLICLATGLVVLFVATTLSAIESAADARVLFAVGAAPSLLRGHLAARAGYLGVLGCVLAVPAGLTPALGLALLAELPVVVPWRELALVVFVLPVVAYAGTWIFAALRGAAAEAAARGSAG